MASFLKLYNEIEYKIKQAEVRLKEYRQDIESVRSQNRQLAEENERLNAQVADLQEKYNLLTITKTILKKEDKIETKKKINDLVREIDNCIGFLNNDNGK